MNTMEMKQKLKTMYPKSENWACLEKFLKEEPNDESNEEGHLLL